jgi:1-acyl-sn-glycerol-3-phosphate acyltransferase
LSQTSIIVRGWRITRITLHVVTGITLAALVLPVCNRWMRLGLIQWWCKRLLHCFNLRVTTSGELPDIRTHGVLFVANHISWSDIHAINSLIPVRFVAKMEIKDWPIFGYLVRKSGTIFINRTRNRDAARVVNICSHALKLNDNLCVFPEGTTTEGLSVLPFKSSLLQAAIEANSQIIPVAIHYPLPDGQPNLEAAYAGDTTIIASMSTYLKMQQPTVHLHFGTPITASGQTRQQLAQQAHTQIHAALFA